MDSEFRIDVPSVGLSEEEEEQEDDDFCELSDGSEAISEMYNSDVLLTHNDQQQSENVTEKCNNQVGMLSKSNVRWFYSSSKHGKLKPFIGNDSLRIEEAWLQIQNTSNVDEEVTKCVCVRGGMFEVDVVKRECIPVYWSSSSATKKTQVVRGTWFFKDLNWTPIDEDVASRIEKEHLARWMGLDLNEVEDSSKKHVMHTMQLDGYHVEWHEVSQVILYKDATAIRAYRNIAQKLGVLKATSSGYQLHRGYKIPAVVEDIALPVTNLVFVIHGIGAKSDRQKIVRNTSVFRTISRQLELKHFTGSRTEFLPIEWRSKLLLDDGAVELITPKKGQGMRKFLNNTALDVMYYTSPLFRSEIVAGLLSELNRVYSLFMEKNPDFSGKISVFAHSLGTVIFHDIITNWCPRDSTYHEKNSMESLNFSVDSLFCIGSPLAMFLCLRGKLPQKNLSDVTQLIPTSLCRRFYNIFHPADPVAYRVEPLLFHHYSNLDPVQLSRYNFIVNNAKIKSTKEEVSTQVSDNAAEPNYDSNTQTTSSSSPQKSNESSYRYLRSVSNVVAGGASRIGGLWSSARGNSSNSLNIKTPNPVQVDGEENKEEISLDTRLDYELQEGFTESKLGYASFTSHTSYWSNQDLSMFLLTELYKETREPVFSKL
uniref:phospholipase DDHD1-like n=1 Tax=Ciona intestinalis TaxID=7719 RepID=UPI000180BF7E|nr:phospholipase DDHD1-like [Ciona intestinalis]|eukprot:XP_002129187.1 phospholipase DDHD1-like [Ciona intestinalis]